MDVPKRPSSQRVENGWQAWAATCLLLPAFPLPEECECCQRPSRVPSSSSSIADSTPGMSGWPSGSPLPSSSSSCVRLCFKDVPARA